MRAVGPLLVGARRFPPRVDRLLGLVAVALLAALVALATFADGGRLVWDGPLVAGVAAGGAAAWRRAPFVVVVVLASAVTALLRLATG
jgi:branched-subunit amino acid transport protein